MNSAGCEQKFIGSLAESIGSFGSYCITVPAIELAQSRIARNPATRDWLTSDRFSIVLYGSLAGVALLLAALGIYGVMAFTVAQRTPEIGLRKTLGAGRTDMVLNVLQEGLLNAGGGLVLGLTGAYFVGRPMQSTLYGTGAMDWRACVAAAEVRLATALIACYVCRRGWRAAWIQ